jgi:uncharacterized protein (TIGR02466 family)
MEVHELFSTPIFHKRAKNHEAIKKYLMEEIYPVYKEHGYNSKSCNVFSDYFDGAPRADQDLLARLYREDIVELLEMMQFDKQQDWQIYTYHWYNITGKGGWQEQHDHISGPLPCQFSMVHYVQFDKNEHSAAEFENPLATILKSMAPAEKELIPNFFKGLHATPNMVKEGDIIIFPAYLKHAVNIQESEKERISTATNIGIWNHRFINIDVE